jgi:hypothetical protein
MKNNQILSKYLKSAIATLYNEIFDSYETKAGESFVRGIEYGMKLWRKEHEHTE